MIKIALTGGIGTGKTYLSKHFIEIGIPVFYADDEAKKMYSDNDFLKILHKEFPNIDIWDSNREIVMEKLKRECVNKDFLENLSKLVHPFVMRRFEKWATLQKTSSVIMESAIVFEYGLEKYFDKIIVADAPESLRILRIKKRNPELSEEEIQKKIALQIPQFEKCSRADLVVCTGETYQITEKFR